MAKDTPIQNTFDGGVLSPLLAGRTDLAKYFNGCAVLENFLPSVQGPLIRRGGTQYIFGTKDNAARSWLIRFQVSERVAYMLEFGHLYVRFYTNRGVLVSSGAPVEVATPYTQADLTAEDGTCNLRVVQSADTMYLLHRRHRPRKLLRLSATSFVLEAVSFSGGPFQDVNTDTAAVLNVSGEAGSGTMSSNVDVFSPSHVGSLFYLETQDLSSVKPWAVHQRAEVNFMRRVDSRVYECTAVGTGTDPGPVTGNVTPTHTEGKAWDGDGEDVSDDNLGPIGVEWQYLHAGFGVVLVTGYTDARHVSIQVLERIPADVVNTGTYKWAKPLFSDEDGWPEHGAFWRQRLVLMAGRVGAMSVTSDFENFAAKSPGGEQETDSSIVFRLNARQINRAVWLVESDNLIIGTDGDEWIVGPIQTNQALGPANIRAERRTAYGSRSIQPVEVGGRVLFIQASGRKLRDYEYSYDTNNYASSDTTKLASNVLLSGVVDLAYQQEPDSIIWAARADGRLVGCTYDQEAGRSDVYAWHPHPMVNGFVEAVETMPSPDGSADDLWMIVRRQVNGQTVRYIEILRAPLKEEEAQAEAFYVDSGLTYRGTTTDQVTGLEHLEGQEVDVLTNGAAHPRRTVVAGRVDLQFPAEVIHVGLPTSCAVATMSLEAGSASGTAQGKLKRITNLIVRMYRSLGGNVGPARDKTNTLNFRRPSQPMGSPPPLFTGDSDPIPWPGGYERGAQIWYTNEQPLPVTLVALMPVVGTSDDR